MDHFCQLVAIIWNKSINLRIPVKLSAIFCLECLHQVALSAVPIPTSYRWIFRPEWEVRISTSHEPGLRNLVKSYVISGFSVCGLPNQPHTDYIYLILCQNSGSQLIGSHPIFLLISVCIQQLIIQNLFHCLIASGKAKFF